MRDDTRQWISADQAHCWHPFTRQSEWCAPSHEPLVISRGEGSWLWDSEGRKYLDGNSSIWTNIHGHAHPVINAAIRGQLERISHSSFLGFTHPLAAELAGRLCALFPENTLERIFFSDDGSTAIECALKMALQYRLQTGEPERNQFIAFANGYHGDTLGAASLGGVGRFFERFRGMGFPVQHVSTLDDLKTLPTGNIAGVVIEPLIQGVNEMRPWPAGMLADLRKWCDETGVHLILDEVMTGFGRTGKMFACQHENVIPDFLCLAKGLTGGYLPLAATLVQENLVAPFRGGPDRTFYHGHSYSGNQLGCAAALANLDLLEKPALAPRLHRRADEMRQLSQIFWDHPNVGDIRQTGLILAIELVEHWPDRRPFPSAARTGWRVSEAARRHGLLTRPVGDVLLLMPPLVVTARELQQMITALHSALHDILPPAP